MNQQPMRVAAAVGLYFAIVFGAGFLLGPIRVLWLEPHIGPLVAVLCEAPFMLVAIVVAARFVPRIVQLPPSRTSLIVTGFGALVLQQLADLAVGLVLRGMTVAQQLAQLATPQGRVYAALLALFALMPLLVNRSSRQ